MSTRLIGKSGEQLALKHLKQQGLKLLTKNYHWQRGEIDLIMRDGSTVTFVEVRMRKNTDVWHILQTIDLKKQQRIILTAQHFLLKQGYRQYPDCRFDIIAICQVGQQCQLHWLKNAFGYDF